MEQCDEGSERSGRGVFDAAPDPILALDPDTGAVADANPAAAAFLGCDRSDLLGADFADLGPTDTARAPSRAEELFSAAEAGAVDGAEFGWELERADGERRPVDVTLERSTLAGEERVLAFVREATERLADGRAPGRRQLEAVFNTPRSFVGLLEPDGTLLRANDMAREFVAATADEFVGDPLWEGPWFDHDRGLQERIESAVARARAGEQATFEATQVTPDGEVRDVEGTIRPVEDETGDVELLVAHGTDVTERKRHVEQVEYQRERLQTILDNAPIVLLAMDEDGVFTESRGAALETLGMGPHEAVGESVFEMYADHPDMLAGARQALGGEQVESEFEVDGQHFQTVLEPVFEDGEVSEVVGVAHHVTELKAREQQLRAWRDRLQTVLDNAPIVLFTYTPDGEVKLSHGSVLSSFGIEPDELVGESVYDLYGENQAVVEDFERAAAGETVTSVREFEDRFFRTWYRPIERAGTVKRVIGVGIDITEQKRQARRLEAVSDATSDLIDARSPDAVGKRAVDIAADALERPLSGVWTYDEKSRTLEPVAATDTVLETMDTDSAADALPTLRPGTDEMATFEDGDLRIVEDYGALEAPSHPGGPMGTVAFVPLGEYGQLHVGSPEVRPFSDPEVDLVRILARNVEAALERAERERALAEYRQELERSNESLQQFAYIASHDLQEPLRMVSSYVDLLDAEYGDELDDEASQYMEFAVDGASRMQAMIEALLEYSRVQTQGEEFTPTDTTAVLGETLQDLALLLEETDAEVRYGDLPTVEADRSQLGQVFQNLVENAVKHSGETAPEVEVRATERDGVVEFAVADDGVGIPESRQDRIFEIFKRGERASDGDAGTGIGLAMCRRIVHRHGGDIWVESAPAEGATFRFTVPKSTDDTPYTQR